MEKRDRKGRSSIKAALGGGGWHCGIVLEDRFSEVEMRWRNRAGAKLQVKIERGATDTARTHHNLKRKDL